MADYIEERYKAGFNVQFAVTKRLYHERSEFQDVEIVETTHHGRMLFNDGCVMLSERDEAIYHEMMAHVPLFVHPNPRRVLIIGGGDGGTAREVLRHPSVETCVMVEIDGKVVESCREFIPKTAAKLNDPRLRLVIDDGVRFVDQTNETFDVVLVDSTDPVGPAQPLFGPEFYRNVHRILDSHGIVVAQGETPFYEPEAQLAMMKVMGQFFRIVKPFNFTNMTYPGGLWTFMFAAKTHHPQREFDAERVQNFEGEFFYYNDAIHVAAFMLPTFMYQQLSPAIKEGL